MVYLFFCKDYKELVKSFFMYTFCIIERFCIRSFFASTFAIFNFNNTVSKILRAKVIFSLSEFTKLQ